MNPEMMSEHQKRIAEFMRLAGQDLPDHVTVPSREVRELRARLILEEAIETIDALGFCAEVVIRNDGSQLMKGPIVVAHDRGYNLTQVADGCADISVVTVGTLLAFGIADKPLLEEVDRSNLAKFELPKCAACNTLMSHAMDSNYCCTNEDCESEKMVRGPYRRDDGKWIKGPNWTPPDIDGAILKSNDPSVSSLLPSASFCEVAEEAYIKQRTLDHWRHPWVASEAEQRWPPDLLDRAKEHLVAHHEFEAAAVVVAAILRIQAGVPASLVPVPIEDMTRSIDVQRVQCHHCRGILSQKLVKDMLSEARRKEVFRCPECMKILNGKDLIYA